MENKPLTPAQLRRLLTLNERVLVAQRALDEFVEYLRDEHDAYIEMWDIRDIQTGFVRREMPDVTNHP